MRSLPLKVVYTRRPGWVPEAGSAPGQLLSIGPVAFSLAFVATAPIYAASIVSSKYQIRHGPFGDDWRLIVTYRVGEQSTRNGAA